MDYEERRAAGLEALRANDAAGAEVALAECVAERPDDPEALLYLGISLGILGRLPEAQERLEAARQHLPDDSRVLFNLARLHHRQGDAEAAAEGYREVLRRDPSHAKAREALASLSPPPTAAPPARAPWEAPTDVEAAVPKAGPRAPWEAPAGAGAMVAVGVEQAVAAEAGISPSDYALPLDDQMIRRVDLLSALKVGVVYGLGCGLLYGIVYAVAGLATGNAAHYTSALTNAIGDPLATPLATLVAVALYNVLAGWLGPVAVSIERAGPALQVARVDAFAAARMFTALYAVALFLVCLLAMPLVLLGVGSMGATAGAAGAAGAGAAAVGVLIVFGIGLVIGLGLVFVGALITSAVYNFAVSFTGGIQFRHRGGGGQSEVRSILFWPTWLSVCVANSWWLLLYAGLGTLIFMLGEQAAGVQIIVVAPLLVVVSLAVNIGLYNLGAGWLGGVKVELEEY